MSLWERVKRVFAPPVFEGDQEKTQQAALLTIIIWVILVGASVGGVLLGIVESWSGLVPVLFLVTAGVFALLLVLLRLGFVRLVGVLVPLLLLVVFTIPAWLFDGLRDTAMMGYFLVIIVTALVSTMHVLAFFTAASMLTTVGLYFAELNGLIVTQYSSGPPLSDVVILSLAYVASGLMLRSAVGRIAAGYARVRQIAEELEQSNQALETNQTMLEDQAQTLERRARYLQASAVVARQAASTLGDLRRLLGEVARVVGEQFGFYHVGLFLLDERHEWAELVAASSGGGRDMLAQGHRLRVGEQGIVGDVALRGTVRVARDTGQEAAFFDNPYLPDTRSEIALPLQVGTETIGVLDVQSTVQHAFGEQDVTTLQAVADQVALAISNARLLQQVQESAEAERRVFGEMSQEAWLALLRARQDLGYVSDAQGVAPAGELWEPQMERALSSGQAVLRQESEDALSVPIVVRGQVIGVVDGRKPDGTPWTPDEIALWETMTEQLNVALEGARLFQETQERAARDRVTSEVAASIRASLNIDTVLQTAVQEIRQALGLHDVTIELQRES